MSSPLNVHLEQYDGPLDLLLDLIRKQQIDIKDIPIATITPQYLEYHGQGAGNGHGFGRRIRLHGGDPDPHQVANAAAARPGAANGRRHGRRSRQELVDRLLEHERFKNAAEMLQQKRMIEENVWSQSADQSVCLRRRRSGPGHHAVRPGEGFRRDAGAGEEPAGVRSGIGRRHGGGHDPVFEGAIPARPAPDQPVFIMRIFEQQRTRRAMIALFLAVLEMVRMQAVVVTQKDLFGEIALKRHASFDAVFCHRPAHGRDRERLHLKSSMDELETNSQGASPELNRRRRASIRIR